MTSLGFGMLVVLGRLFLCASHEIPGCTSSSTQKKNARNNDKDHFFTRPCFNRHFLFGIVFSHTATSHAKKFFWPSRSSSQVSNLCATPLFYVGTLRLTLQRTEF